MCAPRLPGTAGCNVPAARGGLQPPLGGCGVGRVRLRLRAYNTTFTIGCVLSVRYSSSSCSRLVAVTVKVNPR